MASELSDFFTFYVPGFQYTPLFKKKLWDGKIRLFDRRYYTLPRGLVPYLDKFAKDRDYHLAIDSSILLTTNFSIAEAEEFVRALKLPLEARPYQIEAFARAIRNRRMLLVSPTASGKSLIIYLIVRWLQQNHEKGIVIVPTTSLVEQLYKDFQDYGWDSDKHAHKVYSGKEKHTKQFLTISTWQTLHRMPAEYLAQFDFVVGDEAHLYKAKAVSAIMTNLIRADVRIGTTGTLDGTKTHKLVLEGHFGPVFQTVTTRELMDTGKLANLKIKCLILKYPEGVCRELRKSTYSEEYEGILKFTPRQKFLRNLALSLEGNTLVLFQLIGKHGNPLFEDIRDHATKHQVFFVHGEVDTEDREEVRAITEKSNNAIIVASYGTFSTGINIKNLHNVIFAAPSKSRIRNLQSIGRGLRLAEGKDAATLFDIVDDLRIGKHVNFLLRHYEERVKIYNSEKFTFKQYLIDL